MLARLRETLLRHAAGILSGPGGLAAFLRTRLTGDQFPSASLPLDAGTPASLITGALRRAVSARDRHCAFPGCDQPPAACQAHHLHPRAHGGETRLDNLILLCAFHHQPGRLSAARRTTTLFHVKQRRAVRGHGI